MFRSAPKALPCGCPIRKTLPYYIAKEDVDNERGGDILWHAGPARAWPPTDLVEFVIDEIDEKLFEPEVKQQSEVNLVNGLLSANMPTFSDVGQPAKRDIPTKFCWW